jgi:isopentenyl-diphosphate delta-isomerase
LEQRKNDHIAICQTQNVQSQTTNGLDRYHLEPRATSELSYTDLNLNTEAYLGRSFPYPLLITGMTGGVDRGALINRRLGALAARHGIPMGVGSQRIALEDPKYEGLFQVKKTSPGVFLIANLGAAQICLSTEPRDLCLRAVEMIGADALGIHLNLLQELVQKEGDRGFPDLLPKLAQVVKDFPVPILVKEVGSGLGEKDAQVLSQIGIGTLDVGGSGGTSWPYIEGLRDKSRSRLGETFQNWGFSTAESLRRIRGSHPHLTLSATGGLRSGLDLAKVLALGATLGGVGLPFFRQALISEEALEEEFQFFVEGLQIAMAGTGSQKLSDLKKSLITL